TETIANHLCYLIEKGLIKESNYNKIISNNKVHKIIKAIKEVGVDKLTPIKEALGDEFNWEEIKLAKAIYLKRGQ
ncbi:MAG: helix-turn-helix domain-containing protein, partial [Candidatus Falkowbacteria bacterium]|nr:helix-turn-helix domain-containing protein [Candidatus Falkowbacteria bacterium]